MKGHRLSLAPIAATCSLVWVIIADLGLFAGLIHRGISAGGVELGWLTPQEAARRIARETVSADDDLIFIDIQDQIVCLRPTVFGWRVRPFDTAREAFGIGRTGLIESASNRISLWFREKDVSLVTSYSKRSLRMAAADLSRTYLADLDEVSLRDFRQALLQSADFWPSRHIVRASPEGIELQDPTDPPGCDAFYPSPSTRGLKAPRS